MFRLISHYGCCKDSPEAAEFPKALSTKCSWLWPLYVTTTYVINMQWKHQIVSLHHTKLVLSMKSRSIFPSFTWISPLGLSEEKEKKKPKIIKITFHLFEKKKRIPIRENDNPARIRLNRAISTILHKDDKTLFNEKAVIMVKVATSSKSRSFFGILKAITNQRPIIGDNVKNVNANVILEKLEELDGMITLTVF